MIDAYEIGIQLALQDDVSAGLQVISRGLADVDHAIDVTSAKLSNLTNLAQSAVGKAVAGVVARQVPGSGQSAQEDRHNGEKETAAASKVERDVAAGAAPSNAPVPKTKEEAAVRVVQQVVAPVAPEQSKSGPVLQDASSAITNAAPPQVRTIAPTIVQVHTPAGPVMPVTRREPVSPEPQVVTTNALSITSGVSPLPKSVTSTDAAKRPGDAPVQQERVVTASISKATARSRAPTTSESGPARPMRASDLSAEPTGTATAPWSGTGTRVLSPRPAAALEQPAAPEARQREQTDGLSGQVMLDGRLVGYWLAEHMAKEASRPPTGTSFFDPRQTPAWTASGSL